ncbi:MAG: hypothetical protein P8P30_02680 [Rickettsiales bacterium]|nr:hypothetical protein [Rickettsiales bacterium]
MNYTKFGTLAVSTVLVAALGACGIPDVNSAGTGIYSKQQLKERKAAKVADVISSKEHSHTDGTVHIHAGGQQVHFHDASKINMADQEGVFMESDTDYDRESTLNDLSEDDADITQWRAKQKAVPQEAVVDPIAEAISN